MVGSRNIIKILTKYGQFLSILLLLLNGVEFSKVEFRLFESSTLSNIRIFDKSRVKCKWQLRPKRPQKNH